LQAGDKLGIKVMGKLLLKSQKSSKFEFETFEKAIQDVNSNPLAYLIDEETGYSAILSVIGHLPCSWDKISFAGVQYPWTFYMRYNSPYKQYINSGWVKNYD